MTSRAGRRGVGLAGAACGASGTWGGDSSGLRAAVLLFTEINKS